MYALVHPKDKGRVCQIEDKTFPVHKDFKWVKFKKSEGVEATAEWRYSRGKFIHKPAPPPVMPTVDPTPGTLDVVQLLVQKGVLKSSDIPKAWRKLIGD